jgi:hypothetical protein
MGSAKGRSNASAPQRPVVRLLDVLIEALLNSIEIDISSSVLALARSGAWLVSRWQCARLRPSQRCVPILETGVGVEVRSVRFELQPHPALRTVGGSGVSGSGGSGSGARVAPATDMACPSARQ